MTQETTIMQTVGIGYAPLTFGSNTIRKLSPKYAILTPGSLVLMDYHSLSDGGFHNDPEHGTESLRVASIYFGTFEQVVRSHWEANHGNPEGKEVVDRLSWLPWRRKNQVLYTEVFDIFAELYGEDFDNTSKFCAIYFE